LQLSGSIMLSRIGVGAGKKPCPEKSTPNAQWHRDAGATGRRMDRGAGADLASFAAIVADRVFGDLALNGLFSGGAAAQQAPFVKQYDIIGERQHRGTMGDHDDSATGGFLVGNHCANDSLGRSV
jgi:hypothetical protein